MSEIASCNVKEYKLYSSIIKIIQFYETNENPYLSINIILLSTLSIINLIEIWDTYGLTKRCKNYLGRYTGYRCRVTSLWPLGAGLWPVPVTFALWVGTIHCQRMQRLGKDISKTIATIKALVSSAEHEIKHSMRKSEY